VCQILSKSDDFSLRYGDLAIFKMAAVRYLGFVMMSQYCIAGHIFVVQILVGVSKITTRMNFLTPMPFLCVYDDD